GRRGSAVRRVDRRRVRGPHGGRAARPSGVRDSSPEPDDMTIKSGVNYREAAAEPPRPEATTRVLTNASAAPRRAGAIRWIICALLFFAATINYIDRQVIGILKPTLQGQFH